ncbi:MAG: outer membrane protein assembly factor BamD [Victivallales bacterium]
MMLKNFRLIITLVSLFFVSGTAAYAGDAEARVCLDQAIIKENSGDFKSAGEEYLASEHYADDPVLKVNAIQKAAECYRRANLLYKEFECRESLLNAFPSSVDFAGTVQREYEIATLFYQGKRDPALAWMPWIKDKDRALETFETVVKHAPFAKFAPEMRLRLGKLYIDANKIDEATRVFRDIPRMYPRSEEAKFAEFELANILLQKARRGDGDGSYVRQAQDSLKKIIDKYPKDPDVGWAKESLAEADQIAAKRLYGLAAFYNRMERTDAAQRYLNEIIVAYPDDKASTDAEELLGKMNQDYKPSGIAKKEAYTVKYKLEPMPDEKEKIMIVPENSNGKWMLPIEDLGLVKKEDMDTRKDEKGN